VELKELPEFRRIKSPDRSIGNAVMEWMVKGSAVIRKDDGALPELNYFLAASNKQVASAKLGLSFLLHGLRHSDQRCRVIASATGRQTWN